MPVFAAITGQERPVEILRTLYRKKALPHALLFTGPEGVGKYGAAVALAMLGNCSGLKTTPRGPVTALPRPPGPAPGAAEPCGSCPACRKIISASHPDVIHLQPTGATIRIARIRALCETLSLKPYEARMRVVIITDAHAMTPAAGNALLKMLEEPPERTTLILTARQSTDLLPTIVSRCQSVRFAPIARRTIAAKLVEEHGLEEPAAWVLAAVADGSLTRVNALRQSDWLRYRNWLITASGLAAPETLGRRDTGRLLAFAEKLSAKKELVSDALNALLTWLRDLIVCRYAPERIVNTDLTDQLQKAAALNPVDHLLCQMETLRAAQKDLDANANLRLALETMMLRLAAV
ncbi:MAG: DNA polymerase III subunit delta' [Desulfobacterales bacterium]